MIKRIVKLTFRQDAIEDFKKIFDESKNKIKAREGCHHVELLQNKAESHIFFTFSLWENEDALNAYRNSELFAITWAKTKVLFADKPAAWSLEMIDAAL